MSNEPNIDTVSNKWNIRQGDRYITLDNTESYTVNQITNLGDVEFASGEFESIFESVEHLYFLQYSVLIGDVYETVGDSEKRIYRVVDVNEVGRVSYTVDGGEVQKGLHTVDFNSRSLRRIAREPDDLQPEEFAFSLEVVSETKEFTYTETHYFLDADDVNSLYEEEADDFILDEGEFREDFLRAELTVFDDENNILRSLVVTRNV